KPLNIAGVYSYSPNEESTEGNVKEKHSRDSLDEIIADYNATFGTNLSTDTFQGYFNHISNSVKKGVKDSKIDVLIVVNMFLTGFDSKVLNTLYVDRNLKHHDLIQAYSRTNRVEKETKPFGKIVNYRNLKRQTDEALKLFSQTEDTDRILMRSYEEYLSEFVDALAELKTIAQNPEDMDNVFDENDKKSFVEAFRLVSKLVLRLKTFEEFNFTNENIGMGEQEFEDYKSKYYSIYDEVKNKHGESEKVTILNDIDFEIEILSNNLINVSYIMELESKIDLKDKEEQQRNREQIRRILDNADDPILRLKRDLIREFIDEVVPKLSEEDDIDEVYLKFENAKREEEFKKFAHQQAVDEEILKAITGEFEFSGIVNQDELKDLVGDKKLREKRQTKKAIASYIEEVSSKYSF